MADLVAVPLPVLVRTGIWVYTGEAVLGVLLAVVALVDGTLNLLAVRRSGNGRQAAAWLWLGIGATAFIAQAKLAVIVLVVVAGPPSPVRSSTIPLVVGFVLAGGVVLAIQIATIAGRSALRRNH